MNEPTEKDLQFFKEAFCIDGEAKFVVRKFNAPETAIELNDTKRGRFYIAIVSPQGE